MLQELFQVPGDGWDVPLPVLRISPANPPGRPVVLVPHRDGVDEFVMSAAHRLTTAGLTVYVPDVYHGQWKGLPPRERKAHLRDDLLRADLDATADLVAAHDHGPAPAILGFCMGGRVAVLGAAAPTRFRLAISCYGGDLDRPWGDGQRQAPIGMSFDGTCPVELHCGLDDPNPAPDLVHAMAAALRGQSVFVAVHQYEAGHAFCNSLRPEVYRPEAAALAWSRIIARLLA